MLKKILLFLLAGFVVIQFFHPKPNKDTNEQVSYIGKNFPVPDDVNTILKKACNDCHSNNTRYPWYSNIEPVDWWMTGHIRKGKRALNFDEFLKRRLASQYNRFKDIIDEIKQGDMPLNSYLWIHKDARLTQDEKDKVIHWATAAMDSMKLRYPSDSLTRKR